MKDFRGGVTRAFDRLASGIMVAAAVSLVIMVLVQAWQVFARYVLNDSPGWTEPVALLFMSFVVMFGAAIAVRRESHFAFQGIQHSLPTPFRRAAQVFARLIAVLAGLGLMVLGATLLADEWAVPMAGVPLPSGLRYLGLAVGGGLIVLFACERLLSGDVTPVYIEDIEAD